MGFLDAIGGWVSDAIDTAGGWVGDVLDAVYGEAAGAIDAANDTVDAVAAAVGVAVSDATADSKGTVSGIADAGVSAFEAATAAGTEATSSVGYTHGEAAAAATDAGKKAIDEVAKQAPDWIDRAIETVEKAKPGLPPLLGDVADWMDKSLTGSLIDFATGTLEKLEPEAVEMLRGTIDRTLEIPGLPPDIVKLLEQARNPTAPVMALVIPIIIAGVVGAFIGTVTAGPMELGRQESNKVLPATLLGPGDYVSLLRRGELSPEMYTDDMLRLGFNDERRDLVEKSLIYYPGVGDLIRWTVRDVFRPDVVAKYGYDTDFDKITTELEPWLKALGVPEDVIRNYWRAHWELPPVSAGYEMLHRRTIEKEDLESLLRINDVAPFWINKLIDISYSPYTRVDARRMYAAGVLDEMGLYNSYRDIGYDHTHALNLTEWTKRDTATPERDLTRSQIVSAYTKTLITPEDAKTMLGDLGYDRDEAELILALEDYGNEQKHMEERIAIEKREVLYGIQDVDTFKGTMTEMGISQRRISILVDELFLDMRKRHALPSKADLQSWYKKQIIKKEEFQESMALLGYRIEDVGRYLKAMET